MKLYDLSLSYISYINGSNPSALYEWTLKEQSPKEKLLPPKGRFLLKFISCQLPQKAIFCVQFPMEVAHYDKTPLR